MNVVYTFDDGYSEISAVSIFSLLKNNSKADINLFIVDCGISEVNKQKFEHMVKNFGHKLVFVRAHNIEDQIPIKVDVSYWSFVCYVRLFFPQLLPEVDRVLHIDCDTIIKSDLSVIYNKKLNGKLCAACYDCIPSPKYAAGFPNDSAYFSNGFILFDLKGMRRLNIQQKFIDYIVAKNGILPHLDQDVINYVLKDNICVLPPEYNMMTQMTLFGSKIVELFTDNEPFYSEKQIEFAVNNPIMVHLVGYRYVSKPWSQPCYHPYNNEWISLYKQINFCEQKQLLKRKRKKYGFLRELVCYIWNIGYKINALRNLEFKMEKKRVNKKRKKYML